MITGFDKETAPLSATEQFAARYVAEMLKKHVGKANAINNYKLQQHVFTTINEKLDSARIRKIINYLRTHEEHELSALCANSNGYYVAANEQELTEYIESLHSRASAIRQLEEYARKAKRQLWPANDGQQQVLFQS